MKEFLLVVLTDNKVTLFSIYPSACLPKLTTKAENLLQVEREIYGIAAFGRESSFLILKAIYCTRYRMLQFPKISQSYH